MELLILLSHLPSSIIMWLHLLLMLSVKFEEFSIYIVFSNGFINISLIELPWKVINEKHFSLFRRLDSCHGI